MIHMMLVHSISLSRGKHIKLIILHQHFRGCEKNKRAEKLIRVNMKDKYLINMIVCGNDEQDKFAMKFIHLLVFSLININ